MSHASGGVAAAAVAANSKTSNKKRRRVPASRSKVARDILATIYEHHASLHDYLATLVPVKRLAHAAHINSQAAILLAGGLVGYDKAGEAAGRAVGSDYEQRSTQAELVNRAIEGLFRRAEKPKHVLAGGYQKRREDAISGIMGVQSYHPNTTVNHIKTPAWCTLLEAVGDRIMLHLLVDVAVFAPLDRRCIMQISGCPLVSLLRRNREPVCTRSSSAANEAAASVASAPPSAMVLQEEPAVDVAASVAAPTAAAATAAAVATVTTTTSRRKRRRRNKRSTKQQAKKNTTAATEADVSAAVAAPTVGVAAANSADTVVPTSSGVVTGPASRLAAARAAIYPEIRRSSIFYVAGSPGRLADSHDLNTCTPTARGSARLVRIIFSLLPDSPRLPRRLRVVHGLLHAALIRHRRQTSARLLSAFVPTSEERMHRQGPPPPPSTSTTTSAPMPGFEPSPYVLAPKLPVTLNQPIASDRPSSSVPEDNAYPFATQQEWSTEGYSATGSVQSTNGSSIAHSASPDFRPNPPTAVGTTPTESGCRTALTAGISAAAATETTSNLIEADSHRSLVSQHSSYFAVTRYLVATIRSILPHALLGSAHNWRVLARHIGAFVRSARYEIVSLNNVMVGLRISDMVWTAGHTDAVAAPAAAAAAAAAAPGKKRNSRSHSPSESRTRAQLARRFVYWVFSALVIPLLRCHFYVTESGAHKNRVFFFRRPIWSRLQAMAFAKVASGPFRRLSDVQAHKILSQRQLGCATMRLLPKLSGMRLIVNMGRRSVAPRQLAAVGGAGVCGHINLASGNSPWALSVNQQLANLFHVLTFEKKRTPEPLGASVFGMDDIYRRLRPFVLGLRRPASDFDIDRPPRLSQPVYFVSVDVKNCFDTIKQKRLFDIVSTALREDTYLVRKFATVISAGRRLHREYHRAVSAGELPQFHDFAGELARTHWRDAVFLDQVTCRFEDRDTLLSLLREHIFRNIVRVGRHWHVQTEGIAQGSVLSTLLCNYFYGDLEARYLPCSGPPNSALTLRLVDDFLLLTTEFKRARSFLRTMTCGVADYGCSVNSGKTQTNFDPRGVGFNQAAASAGGLLKGSYVPVAPSSSVSSAEASGVTAAAAATTAVSNTPSTIGSSGSVTNHESPFALGQGSAGAIAPAAGDGIFQDVEFSGSLWRTDLSAFETPNSNCAGASGLTQGGFNSSGDKSHAGTVQNSVKETCSGRVAPAGSSSSDPGYSNSNNGGDEGGVWAPYCGLLINTLTLEVRSEYERYSGSYIRDTLTVDVSVRPGHSLREKLISYLKPKCHALLLDTAINSLHTVRINVYQNFVLCAMKYHCHVRSLPPGRRTSSNPKFFRDTVQSALEGYCRLADARCAKEDFAFPLARTEVFWLGASAFIHALRRKQSEHKDVLSWLQVLRHDTASRLTRRLTERLKLVVKSDANAPFESMLY